MDNQEIMPIFFPKHLFNPPKKNSIINKPILVNEINDRKEINVEKINYIKSNEKNLKKNVLKMKFTGRSI
tara:strand:+ start:2917 stop:3126 length:210 start_codon:yes stop_codon:yes gene_type:complete